MTRPCSRRVALGGMAAWPINRREAEAECPTRAPIHDLINLAGGAKRQISPSFRSSDGVARHDRGDLNKAAASTPLAKAASGSLALAWPQGEIVSRNRR